MENELPNNQVWVLVTPHRYTAYIKNRIEHFETRKKLLRYVDKELQKIKLNIEVL